MCFLEGLEDIHFKIDAKKICICYKLRNREIVITAQIHYYMAA